jgi:hypothetical protein
MFSVTGQVVAIKEKEFGKEKNHLNEVQLMVGSDSSKRIVTVADFQQREYKVGDEVTIFVSVSPWVSKSGNTGLNLKAFKDQSAASAVMKSTKVVS